MNPLLRIRSLATRRPRANPALEAARLRDEIVAFYQSGEVAQAVDSAQRLVALQKETLGESHLDYAKGLQNLARLVEWQVARTEICNESPKTITTQPIDADAVVLDFVLSLEYARLGELDALRECQDAARWLRDGINPNASPIPTTRDFHALASLIERGSDLSDVDWADAYQCVSSAFGRSLASAATKGHLRVSTHPTENRRTG